MPAQADIVVIIKMPSAIKANNLVFLIIPNLPKASEFRSCPRSLYRTLNAIMTTLRKEK